MQKRLLKIISIKNIALVVIFALSLLLMKAGFQHYKLVKYTQSAAFFVSGLIIFIPVLFFMSRKDTGEFVYSDIIYKKQAWWETAAKVVLAAALIYVGQSFFINKKVMLSVVSYVFSIIQIYFIFRVERVDRHENTEPEKDPDSILVRVLRAVFLLAALIIFMIAYVKIKNFEFRNFFFLLIFASVMFGFASDNVLFRTSLPLKGKNLLFEYIFLIIAGLTAFYIRSKGIMNIPAGCSLDEGLVMYKAKELLVGGYERAFLNNVQFQVGTMYYYVVAWLGRIFGLELHTLRIYSAVAGSLTVVFIYLMVKEVFGRRVAVISSIMLTFSYVHIIYSRIAWLWIYVPLFTSMAFYFYFLGERTGKKYLYVLSGALLGINLHFYNAAKFAPLILVSLWMVSAFYRGWNLKQRWKSLFILVFASVAAFWPIIDYIIHYKSSYFYRITTETMIHKGVDIFSWSFFNAFIPHTVQFLMSFTTKASDFGYFNFPYKPLLDYVTGFLFIVGFGYMVFNFRKRSSYFMLSWFFLSLLGVLFSKHSGDPNTQRMFLVFPGIVIIASVGMSVLWSAMEKIHLKIAKIAMPVIVIFLLIFSSWENIHTYFKLYGEDNDVKSAFFYESCRPAFRLIENKDAERFVSPFFNANSSFSMLISDQKINYYDVSRLELYKLYNNSGKDVLIVAEGLYADFMSIYKEYFPNAVIEKDINIEYKNGVPGRVYRHADPIRPEFFSINCTIPASDIKDTFALKASYYKAGIIVRKDILRSDVVLSGADYDRVVLESLIDIPVYGEYIIFCTGSGLSKVYVDGTLMTGKMKLYKGFHRIRIDISGFLTGESRIMWEGAIGGVRPVGINYFINSDRISGVMADYVYEGKFAAKELEPIIGYRYYLRLPRISTPQGLRYDIKWTGKFNIEESGNYKFHFVSPYDQKIIVDGVEVFSKKDQKDTVTEIYLKKGKHSLIASCDFKGTPSVYYFTGYFMLYITNEQGFSRILPYDAYGSR